MAELFVTDEEKRVFDPETTRGWALDYFYRHGDAPLHFGYRDGVVRGELSERERRNQALTEGIWLNAYNYCVVHYGFLYRDHALQLPLQAHLWGARRWPPESSAGRAERTAAQVYTDLAAWLEREGWRRDAEARTQPAREERRILLGAPDRTMRIVSLLPAGNAVVAETVITWTEAGVLKETAFAVVLLFDVDGTVLLDRSYCDMVNWPSSPGLWPGLPREGAAGQGDREGYLAAYYERYGEVLAAAAPTADEGRLREFAAGPWREACAAGEAHRLCRPERYRLQLPLQKLSLGWGAAMGKERRLKEAVPQRTLAMPFTYAKGNRVAAECILAWEEGGVHYESPFLSMLLFDGDGAVIRERNYVNLAHWPGAVRAAGEPRVREADQAA